MEQGFSILMFFFAVILFLYALIMMIKKDYRMLPVRARISVKPKHPEQYTIQFSKVIMLCALAIALGAAIALWNMLFGVIVLIAGLVLVIWIGTKIVKNE